MSQMKGRGGSGEVGGGELTFRVSGMGRDTVGRSFQMGSADVINTWRGTDHSGSQETSV